MADKKEKPKGGWYKLLKALEYTPAGGAMVRLSEGRIVKLDAADVDVLGVHVAPASADDVSIGGSGNVDLTAEGLKAKLKAA